MANIVCSPSTSASKTPNLAANPTVGGIPAKENIMTKPIKANQGCFLLRPFRPSNVSQSYPLRDRTMSKPKVPKVVKTYVIT